MLYSVEIYFSDPSREAEWHAWYETYLRQLVSLPGLSTAQRFRSVGPPAQPWTYLALYSLASLDVFASEAYHRMGGGGNASVRFHGAIRRRRNAYTGLDRLPAVTEAGRILLSDETWSGEELADCLGVSLHAVARQQAGATQLDGTPSQRTIAVIAADTANRLLPQMPSGLVVYAPLTPRYV